MTHKIHNKFFIYDVPVHCAESLQSEFKPGCKYFNVKIEFKWAGNIKRGVIYYM